MVDVVIIGAGPAGFTAGLYAKRGGHSVVIFEEKAAGGQIVNAKEVANYPGISSISGYEFATILLKQCINYGCEIKYKQVCKISKEKTLL